MSKQNELVNLARTGASGGGSKNLIINGAMQVAQRGTAAHNEGNGYFALDRWKQEKINQDQFTYSVEQVSDAPSGFSKCLRVTTSTAETALASDEHSMIYQVIEGNNLERVGFGTADAKQLTLSFWVKSTITGDFSSSIYISDANKLYSQAYTISSANTWEYKTLTFPALTSGAPNIDNTAGAFVYFGLFAGSGKNTATTNWTTYNVANILGGQTANLGGTLNASWRITGVQLEIGDKATDFEHRTFADEFVKCQRYYYRYECDSSHDGVFAVGNANSTNTAYAAVTVPTPMRAEPSLGFQTGSSGMRVRTGSGSSKNLSSLSIQGFNANHPSSVFEFVATITTTDFTAGDAAMFRVSTNDFFDLDAEL